MSKFRSLMGIDDTTRSYSMQNIKACLKLKF